MTDYAFFVSQFVFILYFPLIITFFTYITKFYPYCEAVFHLEIDADLSFFYCS